MRLAARRAPQKSVGAAAAEAAPAREAARRQDALLAALRQLHERLVAALEQLEQACAAWLATPQKQQVRSTVYQLVDDQGVGPPSHSIVNTRVVGMREQQHQGAARYQAFRRQGSQILLLIFDESQTPAMVVLAKDVYLVLPTRPAMLGRWRWLASWWGWGAARGPSSGRGRRPWMRAPCCSAWCASRGTRWPPSRGSWGRGSLPRSVTASDAAAGPLVSWDLSVCFTA